MDFNGDGVMDAVFQTDDNAGSRGVVVAYGPLLEENMAACRAGPPALVLPLDVQDAGVLVVGNAQATGPDDVLQFVNGEFLTRDGGVQVGVGLPVADHFDGYSAPMVLGAVTPQGRWNMTNPTAFPSLFGTAGDLPLPGDYLGAGYAQRNVIRNAAGAMLWLVEIEPGGSNIGALEWGYWSDVPIPADYDRDGRLDYAVYRPSNGQIFILHDPDPYQGTLTAGTSAPGPFINVFPCAVTSLDLGVCTWVAVNSTQVDVHVHVRSGLTYTLQTTCRLTASNVRSVIFPGRWGL